MWLKNSAGQRDAIFTLAVLSWLVVAFCIVFPMFEGYRVAFTEYEIPKTARPSTELLMAFLAATFVSYVTRRNKKDQLAHDEKLYEDVTPEPVIENQAKPARVKSAGMSDECCNRILQEHERESA